MFFSASPCEIDLCFVSSFVFGVDLLCLSTPHFQIYELGIFLNLYLKKDKEYLKKDKDNNHALLFFEFFRKKMSE